MFGKVVFKKETQMEIEKLLPVTFHFIIWGSPLPLIQELINVLRKCAVQDTVPVVEKHSDGFPDNIQLFLGQKRAFESQDSCLSASTHYRPGSVQRYTSM